MISANLIILISNQPVTADLYSYHFREAHMVGMRVLVTGADGYIGAVLGPTLLERGFDVVGVDCGFYRDGWLYNDARPRPLTFTKDVRRVITKDVEGFDAVVHLAELSNDPLGELNERTTYEINHLGSVTLARACKRQVSHV